MERNGAQRKYTCLIFDADHTLLNYLADERAAFEAVYAEIGVQTDEALLAFSRFASEDTWTAAGMYDVHDEAMQKRYHTVYRTHVTDIFRRVYAEFPSVFAAAARKTTAQAAGERFLKYLERESALLPYAKETLCALKKDYRLCIATNGIAPVQRGRLRALAGLVEKTFISEEVGAIKPQPAFFDKVCAEMGAERAECLMIGDSLSSDVAGAQAAGIDSCWISGGAENTTAHTPTYEVADLKALVKLLKGEDE